jgi:hypothetical protein
MKPSKNPLLRLRTNSGLARRDGTHLPICQYFICSAVLLAPCCLAQLTTLQTGGSSSSPLTATQQLTIASSPAPIEFKAGFATDETPQAGLFPDSFTITLQDRGQSGPINTLVLATIDLFGAVINPNSPPGITASPNQITLTPISDPPETAGFVQKYSFDLQFSPPIQFAGEETTLFFDLFDNQQAPGSMGWFTPALTVPEPDALPLLLLAFGLVRYSRTRKF